MLIRRPILRPPALPSGQQAGHLLLVMIVAACALVYSPTLDHDFVNFDDNLFIYENPFIRTLDGPAIARLFELQILTPFYKPLVYLSWALEHHFFGLDPRVFHFDNLLLHLANVTLVYWLLWLMSEPIRRAGKATVWGVVLVTALFALHPMRVECVAWATARKDVLFGFFFLGSLITYCLYIKHRKKVFLATSCLLFLLGTLCKSAIVVLPPTLLLVDYIFRRRDWKRLALDKVPYAVILLAALGLYGMLFHGPPTRPLASARGLIRVSAEPAEAGLPAGIGDMLDVPGEDSNAGRKLVAAGNRIFGFTGHLLVPRNLSVIYPMPDFLARPLPAGLPAAAGVLLVLIGGVMVFALRKFPVAGAGLAFYLLTLAPALAGPVAGTNFLSDRYTYIPSIGWGVVVVAALAAASRALPRWKHVVGIAAAFYVLGLAVASARQVGVWRNSVSLWDAVIERHAKSPVAFNNRGVALEEGGDTAAAHADFDRAIELDALYFRAWANRGLTWHELGDSAAAIEDLDRAISLQPRVGGLHRSRGLVAVEAGHVVAGISDYSLAIALEPDVAESYLLRGAARQLLGDFDGAIADFDRLLEMGGHVVEARIQRGVARMRKGDYAGAVSDNTIVLGLDADNAQAFNNRGFARFYLGELDRALSDLDQAIALDPSLAIAYRNRGDVQSALGSREKGCADWRFAERLGALETTARLTEFCPAEAVPSEPGAPASAS